MSKAVLDHGQLVIAVLGLLAIPIYAQSAAQTNHHQKKAAAVTALRAINTAEMRFQSSQHRFGSFTELVSSGQFSKLQKGSVADASAVLSVASSEEDAVPGYKMHLVVAGSGASYAIDLRDTEEPCETAFFSNERGVIFLGQAMGCPSTSPERAVSLQKGTAR